MDAFTHLISKSLCTPDDYIVAIRCTETFNHPVQ